MIVSTPERFWGGTICGNYSQDTPLPELPWHVRLAEIQSGRFIAAALPGAVETFPDVRQLSGEDLELVAIPLTEPYINSKPSGAQFIDPSIINVRRPRGSKLPPLDEPVMEALFTLTAKHHVRWDYTLREGILWPDLLGYATVHTTPDISLWHGDKHTVISAQHLVTAGLRAALARQIYG